MERCHATMQRIRSNGNTQPIPDVAKLDESTIRFSLDEQINANTPGDIISNQSRYLYIVYLYLHNYHVPGYAIWSAWIRSFREENNQQRSQPFTGKHSVGAALCARIVYFMCSVCSWIDRRHEEKAHRFMGVVFLFEKTTFSRPTLI